MIAVGLLKPKVSVLLAIRAQVGNHHSMPGLNSDVNNHHLGADKQTCRWDMFFIYVV